MRPNKTTEEFINEGKKKFGDKFTYDKTQYKKAREKVIITCKEHGDFEIKPADFLRSKYGCQKCFYEHAVNTTEEFIKKAEKVHGNKYDYSKVDYKNNYTPVCIICHKHGAFMQTPKNHLQGHGCQKCSYEYSALLKTPTTEEFKTKATIVHGDKYDYSKVVYVRHKTPVCIICKKHGPFMQTPTCHLQGHGCPKCAKSKLEDSVKSMLERNNIEYMTECSGKIIDGLKQQRVDVYVKSLNLVVECQGIQHFSDEVCKKMPSSYRTLDKQLEYDMRKYDILKQNNIDVVYFYPQSYNEDNLEFYADKNNIHDIDELEKYVLDKVQQTTAI